MSGRRRYRQVVFDALPDTTAGIHEKTGLGKTTIHRWIKSLHEAGEVHISSWRRVEGGGPFMAVYAPGAGEDAQCRLKPLTEAQKSRRYRARARKSGEWEERLRVQRARYWSQRPAARDPLISALFGNS